jgi:hypothetical protein
MRIVGAGMAGLLAANMLRRHHPVIYERKGSLPFNHSAVLRFRNEGVSRATGIPFKKVLVHKAIVDEMGKIHNATNIRLNNMYAQKVVGRIMNRSSMSLAPVERWIAPNNFIELMAACVDIRFNSEIDLCNYKEEFEPVISTMPMPELMRQVNWPMIPDFKFSSVWVVTATITAPEVDVYQTLYFADPELPLYRASITGNRVILEFISDPRDRICGSIISEWLEAFGVCATSHTGDCVTEQRYGKIAPVDDLVRKHFIFTASEQNHIYALGRFATWRQILLDDLVQDIQFIDEFIAQRDLYSVKKSLISR